MKVAPSDVCFPAQMPREGEERRWERTSGGGRVAFVRGPARPERPAGRPAAPGGPAPGGAPAGTQRVPGGAGSSSLGAAARSEGAWTSAPGSVVRNHWHAQSGPKEKIKAMLRAVLGHLFGCLSRPFLL